MHHRSDATTAVCTIVSKNYLPFARTLMASVAKVHPEWRRFVLLADEIDGKFDPARADFTLVGLGELGLPDARKFLYRYDILELNTAVKPWLLQWLFERAGAGRALYIDPDIKLYSPLAEVEGHFARGGFMALTPHLLAPLDDGRRPNDADILRAGCYNLGFLALAEGPQRQPFLEWWQGKLEHDCRVDFAEGLFVDQKWMDLVPGLYDGVGVIRHPGYNVAYWNLNRRTVEVAQGVPTVNGQPLAFFHFSGLDPAAPEALSKHQDRFRTKDLKTGAALVEQYAREVLANGYESQRQWPYHYGKLANGTAIPRAARRLYRRRPDLAKRAGADPFQSDHAYLNEPYDDGPQPLVTRLMHAVWEGRPDLRDAFPDLHGHWRAGFVDHFLAFGAAQEKIPEPFVAPVRNALAAWRAAGGETAAPPVARRVTAKGLAGAAARLAFRFAPASPQTLESWYRRLRPLGRRALPEAVRGRLKRFLIQNLHRELAQRNARAGGPAPQPAAPPDTRAAA